MTSQQEADCALAIWQSQSNRDDQARIDALLKEFFAQVRADEYEETQRRVSEIMSCVPEVTSPVPTSS